MESRTNSLVESYAGLSDFMTSFATATDVKWPKFSLQDFAEHADSVLAITPTEALWTTPIVSGNTTQSWEIYSVQESTSFISPKIYNLENDNYTPVTGAGPFLPIWQVAPISEEDPTLTATVVNFDFRSFPGTEGTLTAVSEIEEATLSSVLNLEVILALFEEDEAEDGLARPYSLFVQPVYDSFEEDRALVALVQSVVSWELFFTDVVFQGSKGEDTIYCVLKNTCGQSYTWLTGTDGIEYQGEGDWHETQFESYRVTTELNPYSDSAAAEEAGVCLFSFDIYPSSSLRQSYQTNKPAIYTSVVGAIFFLVVLTFGVYDWIIQHRNKKLVFAAARSNAIVSALFPSNVRDRLFAEQEADDVKKKNKRFTAPKSGLQDFLLNDNGNPDIDEELIFKTKPIADLFPETTIMFADLVGFTAWSSVREPSQVFTLLETVYHAFDVIAKQRRIFKVETVGDCYVAVAGLPEPRKDHAVAMVKFAHECLKKITELTKRLEVALGPDTGDLTVRVGVHSGPVTAGVLRGERSRFQLFGDTMNTAARMESTGEKKKIQISQETADLLVASGKSHWIKPRAEIIEAKGKGKMQTYWVDIVKRSDSQSVISSNESSEDIDESQAAVAFAAAQFDENEIMGDGKVQRLMSDKTSRLIDWNTDVLSRLLKQIIATREATDTDVRETAPALLDGGSSQTCLEEVKEIITLPEFDAAVAKRRKDPDEMNLGDHVEQQLHDYVSNIAIM